MGSRCAWCRARRHALVARQLREAGVAVNSWEFVVAATLTRTTRSLRAGRYSVGQGTSILSLVEMFRRGDVEHEQLTIVEGSSFAELRSVLAQSIELRHDTADWTESQILHAIGAQEARAEGLFAPDTYIFDPGSSDVEVYRQAYLAQKGIASNGPAGARRRSAVRRHV